MRHVKFVLLNIATIVVALMVFYTYSGISRVGAAQSDDYFVHFYGVETQRGANGAFMRNMRWAAENGALYLVRQPNDDGFNIMQVTATTIIPDLMVDVEIDEQRVARMTMQPQVFRTYATLVRLDWQPMRLWNRVQFTHSATTVVEDRTISLAVSEIVFTPLHSTKAPNNMVMLYLVLVVLLGTWIYYYFSTRVVYAVYGVFGIVLVGVWWYGIAEVVFIGLTHMPLVWFLGGLGINLLLWYYLQRYVGELQQLVARVAGWVTHRLMVVDAYVMPMVMGVRWLWQRPILLYSITVALYFGGWLWGTQVISPISTKFAVNMPFTAMDYNNSGGFFSDYVLFSIPEFYQLTNLPRASWIATWSNMTELGRPLSHSGGWSGSYILTRVMQVFITNPYVFFTTTFVFYVYLTGLFALLYVRRILQHPGLGLIAAYLIAFTPFMFYWNTYLYFYTSSCWAMAILYGLQWLRDERNWKSVLFLMFASYSLVNMGYPQMIIHIAYMMIGYFVYVAWQLRHDRRVLWQFVGCGVGAAIVGGGMSASPYLDILQVATMAVTRQKVGIDYFTDIMPYFERAPQLLRVGFAYILKDIFEPINEFRSNWYPYRGGYTSLFVFLLMMTGAIWRWRQTWGWSLWVIIAVALSFSRTVFAFGYEQLHLPQLSLAVLFFGSGQQIPEMILAVYGMHVIISEAATKSAKVVIRMVIVGVQLILGACAISLIHERNFVWTFMGRYEYIVYEVAVVGLLLLIALTTSLRAKWAITFGIIFLNTVVLLQPLLVTQRLDEIYVTSPTTETIRNTLQPGERMVMTDDLNKVISNAVVTFNEVTPFGGNYNALLQIANMGTYNPLQSKYYEAIMSRFGVPYDYYNRYIRAIRVPMPENDQWMANVRTVVSKNPLNDPNLRFVTQTEGYIPFYVYTTPSTMGCCLQVPLSAVRIETAAGHDDYWVDTPKAPTNRRLEQRDYQGDRFVVPVTESTDASLIVFSQVFNPQWYAQVRTATGWQDAPTVVVNGGYQGVRIPVGAQEVVMEFRPWVWWSIVPNLFWLGCVLFIAGRWLWRYQPLHTWIQQRRTHGAT